MTDSSSSSSLEKLPASRRRLHVKGTPEEVKKTFQEAVREVNKSVTLPGFRKGKAPEKLIEQQFSKAVDKAWRDETARMLVNKGLKETNTVPLFNQVHPPKIETLSKEEGASIEVEFEVEPESPKISLDGFSFEPFETPQEESVEEALETLRTYHGEGTEVTDQPAQAGDLVDLDIQLVGDQAMEVSQGKTFYLHPKRINSWLFDAIVGKSIDTPFEATGEGTDGKVGTEGSKKFQITIRKIRKMTPHPENESLWKKLGVESKEQFLERFKKEHERQVAEFTKQQKRHQLVQFLKKTYPLELPKGLLNYESEIIVRNTVFDLLRQGVTEEWVKNNAHNLRHEAEAIASNRLYTTYLVLGAAKERNVQVLVAELQREKMIEEMARPVKERILLQEMSEKEKENRLYFEILTQKTLDLLAQEVDAKK